MIIAAVEQDHPYAGVIQSLISHEFPASVRGDKATLEALSAEIIGTKQHRYGPTPDPEVAVSLRNVIRHAIAWKTPIPILVPWGASKQGPFSIDLAEIMALKQINCLDDRVRKFYPLGTEIRIRLEDATDYVLFGNEDGWTEKTLRYTEDFGELASVVLNPSISVLRETSLFSLDQHSAQAHQHAMTIAMTFNLSPIMRSEALASIGWTGGLPDEQIQHYRKIYARFYPGLPPNQIDYRIALYFGAALHRRLLGALAMGAGPGWSEWITLSFTPPIPGQDATKRVFYRTIPEHFTNSHRAPWIGKGYIRIRGNQAIPQLAGWNGDGLDYQKFNVKVENNGHSAVVQADYIVEA